MSLFLALLLACSSPQVSAPSEESASTVIAIEATLDEAGTASAEALAAEVKDTHFPSKLRRSVDNAHLFVALAARDTTDHAVVAASLEAMRDTWSFKEVGDKPVADADYAKVVLTYLDHPEPLVQGRAMVASKPLLQQGNPEVIAKITALSSKSSAHLFEALDLLALVEDWAKKPEIASVFTMALTGEAHVASRALFRMETRSFAFADKEAATVKIKALLAHEDPGVRGRAAIALAGFERDASSVGEALAPLLSDAHGFPRSMAARAAGKVRAYDLADELMGMLEDRASNTYDIPDCPRADGSKERLHHDGSPWSRVDDAVLTGLHAMSGGNGTARMELTKIRHDHVDEDLATRVQEARAWYASHRDKLGG